MPTEEEIAEFMKTPEGALELQRILADLSRLPPGISDIEEQDRLVGSEAFPLIKALGIGARGLDTPAEREFLRNPDAPRGLPLETIGASPNIRGATIGLPPETIGASPDILGATRGLPPSVSGMNPVEENRRRMMQQLIPNRGLGLRY
jgi:hypothetical protein